MGPREVRDSFGRMFDFDRDGKIDASEQAAQFDYLEEEEREFEDEEDDDFDDEEDDDFDDEDEEDDDFDEDDDDDM